MDNLCTPKTKFIAIDGLDCCFKETNTKMLRDYLLEKGYKVELVSFPRYGTPTGYYPSQYLKGVYGDKPENVNPYSASLFYLLDFYDFLHNKSNKYIYDNDIVIFDRFTLANKLYHSAKFKNEEFKVEFLDWLTDTEHKIGLIWDADISAKIFLHSGSYEKSRELLNKRSSLDLHESADDYMKRVYDSSCKIAELNNYTIIDIIDEQGQPKSKDEIFENIKLIVDEALSR